jgi:hypothetical protein
MRFANSKRLVFFTLVVRFKGKRGSYWVILTSSRRQGLGNDGTDLPFLVSAGICILAGVKCFVGASPGRYVLWNVRKMTLSFVVGYIPPHLFLLSHSVSVSWFPAVSRAFLDAWLEHTFFFYKSFGLLHITHLVGDLTRVGDFGVYRLAADFVWVQAGFVFLEIEFAWEGRSW